jgi:uroporphyrinogen decarboxylase
MTKREIITHTLNGKKPPYTPWSFNFTQEPKNLLKEYYKSDDIDKYLGNHILELGNGIGFFEDLGNNQFRDIFGVIWDRTIDKDIGNVSNNLLPEPDLSSYKFPDPLDERFYKDIDEKITLKPDLFRVFQIGFSLFERAWTLRGMENLLMDFVLYPEFVHKLLNEITEYNIAQVEKAVKYDIDALYFGDDWGMQHGLIMGKEFWQTFIRPCLKRMYGAAKSHGKYVFIHSCGDVDELFDDLIEIGVNCFNPFQPEVMNTTELLNKYRGSLTFHGGLSTQKTLPYASKEEVRLETLRLIDLGSNGNYILSPAHAVESDVPFENIMVLIETVQSQKVYRNSL